MALKNIFVLLACLVVNRVSQVMNQAYKILSPGQEFYANSVVKRNPSTNKYFVFGGWFKSTQDLLLLNVSLTGGFAQVDGQDSLNKINFSATENVTILKGQWTFVAWINEIDTATSTPSIMITSGIENFYNVTRISAIISRGWSPGTATGDSIGPFPVSNPGINATYAFKYDKTDSLRRYLNLFYSFHDTESIMYRQLVFFMVGPYKGDIHMYRANKLNRNIAGRTTLADTNSNWSLVNTNSLLRLTDREGVYLPTWHWLIVNNFIEQAKINNMQRISKVRTVLMRGSMKFNGVNGDLAHKSNQTLALSTWVNTKACVTVNVTVNRFNNKSTLGMLVWDNGTLKRTELRNLNFAVAGVSQWHHFTIKTSMINLEPYGVPDDATISRCILVVDVSHKEEKSSANIEYHTAIFSGIEWYSGWDTDRIVAVIHDLESTATIDTLHGYLHSLVVMNGGMDYTDSKADTSYNKENCLASTVVASSQSDVKGYCMECITNQPLDKATGECLPTPNPGIPDCEEYLSTTECNAYNQTKFYYNQVLLNNPKLKASGCSSGFLSFSQLFSRQNMSDTCSESDPISDTNCEYFSKYVYPTCTCRPDGCVGCHTLDCDQCYSGKYRIVYGRWIRCESPLPAGYGMYDTNSYIRCLSTGCTDCSADFRECRACTADYVLTPDGSCMLCGDQFRRYFNNSTKICHNCHESCMTCRGPNAEDCLTCLVGDPETRFYLNVTETSIPTGYCIGCQSTQYYKNITKSRWVVGFVSDNVSVKPRCQWCNETCNSCANASFCTSCNASLYIQPYGHCDVCVADGYYIDDIYCKLCNYTCNTCSITDRNCTSCRIESFLTVNSTCEFCDSNCIGCFGNKKNCTACKAGMYRYLHNNWCGYCYEEGVVLNDTSNMCLACGNNCRYCNSSNPESCFSCLHNSYLYPNKTCNTCNTTGKWYIDDMFCKACDASCGTCRGGLATMCVTCDYPFELVAETGRCEFTPLVFTSSYYDAVMVYVVFSFETKVKFSGVASDVVEAAVFIETTSLDDSLKTLQFNDSLLNLSGIAPPTTATVTGIKTSGDSVIVELSIIATVKNAAVVLKFKKSGAIISAQDRTWKFINGSLVQSGLTVLRSSFDSALDSAGATAASAVAIITLPQALVLLKLLNCVGLYVFVDVEFPSNFNKLLEMFSTTIMDFVPNIYLPLADDEGKALPDRFSKYGIEVHFFKNFGPTLTVITAFVLLKLMIHPFRKCTRSKNSFILFRFLRQVDIFMNLEFWMSFLDSIHFDYILSLLVYLSSRDDVDEWKPLNYLIIIGLSASSLSLVTFYCFLTYKTYKLTESFYRYAVLPVGLMKDEPYKFILADKTMPGNIFQRYFTVLGLLKDLSTSVVVYFCVASPVFVTSFLCLTQLIFTLGAIVTPPFSDFKTNLLLQIESVLYMMFNISFLTLALGSKQLSENFKYYFIGFLLCIVLILLIISNIGFTLYYTAVEIIKKYRAYKAKKAEKLSLTETSRHGLSDNSMIIPSKLDAKKLHKKMAKPLAKTALALDVEDSVVSKSTGIRTSHSNPRKRVIHRMNEQKITSARGGKTPLANDSDNFSKLTQEKSPLNLTEEPESITRNRRIKKSTRKRLLSGTSAILPLVLKADSGVVHKPVEESGNQAIRVKRRAKNKRIVATRSDERI